MGARQKQYLQEEVQKLIAEGENIGSWQGKKIYKPELLYEQAEKLRLVGYEKRNAGTLKEAFVLLMRFSKFYDLICAQPNLNKKAPAHQKLKRDLVTAIGTLEELKAKLLDLFAEAAR